MDETMELRKKASNVSAFAYLSESALVCLAGVLDLLNVTGLGLGIAIASTVGASAINVGSKLIEDQCNTPSVLTDFFDAMDEALKRTRQDYKNSAKKTILIEKLAEESFEFDVDLTATIMQTNRVREKYKDNLDVQAIISVFNTHFRIVAANYKSLSNYLLLNSSDSIIESMKRVVFLQQTNGKKIDDVLAGVAVLDQKVAEIGQGVNGLQTGVNGLQTGVNEIKGVLNRLMVLVSKGLELFFNGLLVYLALMVVNYFVPCGVDEGSVLSGIAIGAEFLVFFAKNWNEGFRRNWLGIVLAHSSMLAAAALFLCKLDAQWLPVFYGEVLAVVVLRYSLNYLPFALRKITAGQEKQRLERGKKDSSQTSDQ